MDTDQTPEDTTADIGDDNGATTGGDDGGTYGDDGGSDGDNSGDNQGAGDPDAGAGTSNGLAADATDSLSSGLGDTFSGIGEAASSLGHAAVDQYLATEWGLADGIGHLVAAGHGLVGDEQGAHDALDKAAAFGRAAGERERNVGRDLGIVDGPRREHLDIEEDAGLQVPSWL